MGNVLAIFISGMLGFMCLSLESQTFIFLLTYHVNVPEADIGKVAGTICFCSFIAGIIVSPILGYAVDILGRKVTIGASVILLAIPSFLFPRGYTVS
jgi:MFS family permease